MLRAVQSTVSQTAQAPVVRHTGRALAWTIGMSIVLLAVFVLTARIGLPLVAAQKATIETQLGDRLGKSVDIDALSLRWTGAGPQLKAEQVGIGASEDAHLVTIEELRINVDFLASLWAREIDITEITLVGADLAVDLFPGKMPSVHGFDTTATGAETTAGLDSTFERLSSGLAGSVINARRIGLVDARVTLIDHAGQRRLLIDPLTISAENDPRQRRLRADLSLPPSMGGRLEIEVDTLGSQGLSGAQVQVRASELELQGWHSLLGRSGLGQPALPAGLWRLDGQLNAELQGEWRNGALADVRGMLSVQDIRDSVAGHTLLDRLEADITAQPSGAGWHAGSEQLTLISASHVSTVEALDLHYQPSVDETQAPSWQLTAGGSRLALADVLGVAAVMQADARSENQQSDGLDSWLLNGAPRGELLDWELAVDNEGDGTKIDLTAQFEQLAIETVGRWPGLDGVEGAVSIVDNKGDLTIRGRGMSVELPGILDEPLLPDAFVTHLAVDFTSPALATVNGQLIYDEAALSSTTRLKARLIPGQSPHLDVQSQFDLSDVTQARRYLPLAQLPKAAANWLSQALAGGHARNGEALFFGQIADYPFRKGNGVFNVGFDVEEGELAFLPGWPAVQEITGRFDFDGTRLVGEASSGQLDAVRISHGKAEIRDVRQASLAFSGTAAGNLQSMVDFANDGPLARWLAPALADVKTTGRAEVDLQIDAPLRRAPRTHPDIPGAWMAPQVRGSVFLDGNAVAFTRTGVEVTDARGAINFSTRGIRMNNLRARYLDQAVSIGGRTIGQGADQATSIVMSGALDTDRMLTHFELPLTDFADGVSKWEVALSVPHDTTRRETQGMSLDITSDLVGTRLHLPAPLGKSFGATAPLRVSTMLKPTQSRTNWRIQRDNLLLADVSVEDNALYGLVAVLGGDQPSRAVDAGVRIEGALPFMAAQEWLESFTTLLGALPSGDGEPAPIIPVSMDVQTAELRSGNQRYGSAKIRANTDDAYLNLAIDNQALRGNLRYPRDSSLKSLPMRVRIADVDKRFLEGLETESELSAGPSTALDPRLLPPIEARIAQLRWDQLNVQDVILRTTPSKAGLRIDTLGFAYSDTQLIGEGYWHLRDAQGINPALADQHITSLTLTLQSDDFGNALTRVGFPDTLNEGQGVVSADIAWPGAAYEFDLASLEGSITADIRGGRVLGVNPGAARLVGLFALQTLPRRINLDFKDIVKDGLDFQRITGDINVAEGVASAELIQFNGPVGVIDITGDSNLLTQEYDQNVTVLPRVSAALPVIGVISGGAGAGIGALVAGGLLKAIGIDFDRLGLREYRLGGTWTVPDLQPAS